MKEELKKLSNVQGVIGSLVLDLRGNLLVFEMPAAYSNDKLQKVASVSFMSFKGIGSIGRKASAMEFEFKEYRYFIKEFDGGLLCILGSNEISLPVLNISLNIVIDSLKEQIYDYDGTASASSSPVMYQEFYEELRVNLAKHIGPLAGMIIDEKISELGVGKNNLRQSDAIKLLNLLGDEIDNKAHRREFSETMLKIVQKRL
jgi:hypothetical protein